MPVRQPRIELICTGSELLRDKVNTDVNLIAENLMRHGFLLSRCATVGDTREEIEKVFKESLKRSDVVITCGGLGPTFDDLTRDCVSRVLGRPLKYSSPIFRQIQMRFKLSGLAMPAENRRQAFLIGDARAVSNRSGTAPGQIIEWHGKTVLLLPGPPGELEPMMKSEVLPFLEKKYGWTVFCSCVLHIFGVPESEIDERIGPVVNKIWDQKDIKATFGILAHRSIIDVKVTVTGKNRSSCEKILKAIKSDLRKVLGKDVYGENGESLESVVGKILKRRGETLSVAESCTGGMLSARITGVSGSSAYFKEGVVTYSNQAKMRLLGVKRKTILNHGAVSRQTAEEMAHGLKSRASTDWAVSITGIAGPGGGTRKKPVGLVWLALSGPKARYVFSQSFRFRGSREDIRGKAVLAALNLIRISMADL